MEPEYVHSWPAPSLLVMCKTFDIYLSAEMPRSCRILHAKTAKEQWHRWWWRSLVPPSSCWPFNVFREPLPSIKSGFETLILCTNPTSWFRMLNSNFSFTLYMNAFTAVCDAYLPTNWSTIMQVSSAITIMLMTMRFRRSFLPVLPCNSLMGSSERSILYVLYT